MRKTVHVEDRKYERAQLYEKEEIDGKFRRKDKTNVNTEGPGTYLVRKEITTIVH